MPRAIQSGFVVEGNLLKNFNHPGILKCEETFDEEFEMAAVTEYMEGGELYLRIQRKS